MNCALPSSSQNLNKGGCPKAVRKPHGPTSLRPKYVEMHMFTHPSNLTAPCRFFSVLKFNVNTTNTRYHVHFTSHVQSLHIRASQISHRVEEEGEHSDCTEKKPAAGGPETFKKVFCLAYHSWGRILVLKIFLPSLENVAIACIPYADSNDPASYKHLGSPEICTGSCWNFFRASIPKGCCIRRQEQCVWGITAV